MDAASMTDYIRSAFPGVETTDAFGYTFFFFGAERMLPFATIAHADNEYERVSNLDRPGVYRLNIGVGRETYRSLIGPEPPRLGPDGIVETGHDYTVLDQILPHPHYAPQSWICVLSPSDETLKVVQPLLAEAYDRAVARAARAQASPAARPPSE
jgi:hypothetical protein